MTTIRMILGDQLSESISSLKGTDKDKDIIFMCEVLEEATVVPHHKKKIALIFSAMRHFAEALKVNGYQVTYVKLDDKNNSNSFTGEVNKACQIYKTKKVILTQPSEYRVLKAAQSWENKFKIPVEIREDDRFLCSIAEFEQWQEGRKQLRMEYFYRTMRQKYHILMDDNNKPTGGQWNYDTENRKPPKKGLFIPAPYQVKTDSITEGVLALVDKKFDNHFGELSNFNFAVNREQALAVMKDFIDNRLEFFGHYQDAMISGEPWMYHSHISFYLNIGLLNPLECIQAVEKAYHEKKLPINAAEGFIRQIMGWREYVRGIYWLQMPEYKELNFLEAKRPLPEFYWTGNTKMNCLQQCVKETKQNAYAHHIQRLMVLGNYALLAGINPKEVNEWFLVVYADAFEWVELPNVSGMALFADGGYLASKPYASSGSYINKMSNYCQGCQYNVNEKEGDNACPFNYLYWDFLARNRKKLANNHRLRMMYKTYDNMSDDKKASIQTAAEKFLA